MDVLIKDRKKEIEYFRMALNMCQIGINYRTADLILKIISRLDKTGGDFSLDDGTIIQHNWEEEWDNYFETLKTKNDEKKD